MSAQSLYLLRCTWPLDKHGDVSAGARDEMQMYLSQKFSTLGIAALRSRV
jgi:hypothetical protein